jgi:hypothetical protein
MRGLKKRSWKSARVGYVNSTAYTKTLLLLLLMMLLLLHDRWSAKHNTLTQTKLN